jgi:hypothetical protein
MATFRPERLEMASPAIPHVMRMMRPKARPSFNLIVKRMGMLQGIGFE